MAEAEESEMTDQMGLILRQVTGSGLQAKEMLERRRQMEAMERQRDDQQRHSTEAQVASSIRRDVYDREFWRTAGSESIADRVTVAGALAGEHAEARTAYMHASDLLRNDYGINIEQMNRDYPTSSADRHHALRQALDDYFASHRLDTEADQALGQDEQQPQAVAVEEPTAEETAQQAINARSPAAAAEHAAAQQLSDDTDVDADVQRLVEQQADPQAAERQAVQNTLSSYFPQEQQSQPKQQTTTNGRGEAQQAAASEKDNLADADRYAAEQRRDKVHATAEEQTGGRQPQPYQPEGGRGRPHKRVTTQEFNRIAQRDPQAAESRSTASQNFPRSTRQSAQANTAPEARKNVGRVGAQQSKQKDMELSR